MLCAGAGDSSGKNLSALADELSELCRIFIVDISDFIFTEDTNLFSSTVVETNRTRSIFCSFHFMNDVTGEPGTAVYSDEQIEMISGAEVFVYDDVDTIYFEETEMKGHYQTIDSVAGKIGKTYHLNVTYIDDEGEHTFFSESRMRENTPQIDSLMIKKVSNSFFPGVMDTAVNLYPFFLSVDDPESNYLINIV